MNTELQAIVLAAGKSSRFNTKLSKLAHKICGQEMILYTTNLLSTLSIPITLIVGYQKELIESIVKEKNPSIKFIQQTEQLGTGHALLCSKQNWLAKDILILNGDMPLVNEQIIKSLYKNHLKNNATISFVTANCQDPNNAYGKVIFNENKIKIVEAKDYNNKDKENNLINAGIYLIKKEFLENAITRLQKNCVTGEIYITDLIGLASNENKKVLTFEVPFDLVRGINTLYELWITEQILRIEITKFWMSKGVRFIAPQTNLIDINVSIQNDTLIGASTQILGESSIGSNCMIDSFCIINNSVIENDCIIKPYSHLLKSHIKVKTTVEQFEYINSNVNYKIKSNAFENLA